MMPSCCFEDRQHGDYMVLTEFEADDVKEYQLYLPSKELLRQKLLDWTRDEEAGA